MNKILKQFIYWLEEEDRQNWEIERYFEDALSEQKEELKKEHQKVCQEICQEMINAEANIGLELYKRKLREQKEELMEKVENIMGDTLSADTMGYHKEVDEMYRKLEKL